MNRIATVTVLLPMLLLGGCRTYFGYESTYQDEDIPSSDRLLSSKLESYKIALKNNKISVTANYLDAYEKEVASTENREHIYVKSSSSEARVILLPIVVFDIFGCLTDWHLASNPPATSFLYAPPCSWFAPGIVPPYWLPDPATLKPGENVTTRKSKDGQTHQSVVEKIIEPEKIELSRRIVQYSKNRTAQETEGTIELQIDGHKYELPLSNSILTPELFQTALVPARDVKIKATYQGASSSLNINTADIVGPSEQLQIGKDYLSKQNSEQAELWLHKSADNGNTEAQYLYGKMLMDKNCPQALRYIQLAADQNYPEALVAMGKAYFNGWGVKANKEKAAEYLDRAYGMHCSTAEVPLALMYLNGQGVPEDINKGLSMLKQACVAGDSQAYWVLGSEYISGKHVATDYRKGAGYILKAAEMGNANAPHIVGTLYLYGIGLPQNSAKAVHWLEIAAEQNGTGNNRELGKARSKLQAEQKAIQAHLQAEQDFSRVRGITDPDIEAVKTTVFSIDESRTIQEAISAQMDNTKWRKFKDKSNRTIVEVIGTWNNDSLNPANYSHSTAAMLSGLMVMLPICPQKGDEVLVQFTVNPVIYPQVSLFGGEIRNKNGVIKHARVILNPQILYDRNGTIIEITPTTPELIGLVDANELYITKEGFLMILYGTLAEKIKGYTDI